MTPEFFRDLVIGVGALATGEEAFFAEETFSAGDSEWNHDAIANLQLSVFRSDLDDFAHGLVAENVTLFHRRHNAVEQMEVRTANGASRYLDDGIASMLNLRIRHALAADIVLGVPRKRFHLNSPVNALCPDKLRKEDRFQGAPNF
jgi:hypothetical protein